MDDIGKDIAGLAQLAPGEAIGSAGALLSSGNGSVRSASLEFLFDLIRSGSTTESETVEALTVICRHCAPHPHVTSQVLQLLGVSEHAASVASMLPQLVGLSASEARRAAAGALALLSTDSSLLVPLLGALAELPLNSPADRREVVDTAVEALEVVDEQDVPAVARSLMKLCTAKGSAAAAVDALRAATDGVSATVHRMLAEVLSSGLLVNGSAAGAFLKAIEADVRGAVAGAEEKEAGRFEAGAEESDEAEGGREVLKVVDCIALLTLLSHRSLKAKAAALVQLLARRGQVPWRGIERLSAAAEDGHSIASGGCQLPQLVHFLRTLALSPLSPLDFPPRHLASLHANLSAALKDLVLRQPNLRDALVRLCLELTCSSASPPALRLRRSAALAPPPPPSDASAAPRTPRRRSRAPRAALGARLEREARQRVSCAALVGASALLSVSESDGGPQALGAYAHTIADRLFAMPSSGALRGGEESVPGGVVERLCGCLARVMQSGCAPSLLNTVLIFVRKQLMAAPMQRDEGGVGVGVGVGGGGGVGGGASGCPRAAWASRWPRSCSAWTC